MGLHAEQRQIALHGALGDTGLISQLTHPPVRGALGSACQRGIERHRNVFFAVRARPSRFELIAQPGQALLAKMLTPIRRRRRRHLHTSRGFAYRHSIFGEQNLVRSSHQSVRQAT